MANLELMNYKPQREPVSEQELTAYRTLATAIFSQAVFDVTDKRCTVEKFISAYTWLTMGGYFFLHELLGMDIDQSKYDRFLDQLRSGEFEMRNSKFIKKGVIQ